MCSVPVILVPQLEARFYLDDCECLPAPREMVEYWQPGQRQTMTTVRPVAEAMTLPGLWAAMGPAYDQWRTPLLTYHPEPVAIVQSARASAGCV
jgi:hypothetical protein